MTPKEKAKELVDKYLPWTRDWDIENYAILNAKQCALIAVTEILNVIKFDFENPSESVIYWLKVKQEIEIL